MNSIVKQLFQDLISGKRVALSKAITLVESSKKEHHEQAQALLTMLLKNNRIQTNTHHDDIHKRNCNNIIDSSKVNTPVNFQSNPTTIATENLTNMHNIHHTLIQSSTSSSYESSFSNDPLTFRIGLSGAPGVGKSSFIESFGVFLVEQGNKVAVLAVDPSSTRTGGSILGDKTRMTLLSRNDHAYVRPSPSRGTLGGVARNTNEAILLCEAAGYNIILVETVGVGQSETMVSDMVDMFVLLVAPGSGDELQGMKKGIVELSDLIIVNKSDGDLLTPSRMAQMEYTSALKFLKSTSPLWKPAVLRCSSKEQTGLETIWESMKEYQNIMLSNDNLFFEKRGNQQRKWMWQSIMDELMNRIKNEPTVKNKVSELESCVFEGTMTSGQAADTIIQNFIIKK